MKLQIIMFSQLFQGQSVQVVSNAIVYIVFFLATLCVRQINATQVHLNYTDYYSDQQLTPDDITITISNGSLDLGEAHLKRSPFDFNVPVYSLRQGPDGKITCLQEKLKDLKNIGFYQDLATEAVIQVTSTFGPGTSKPHLVLKGELSLGGQKYTLKPNGRHKRGVSTTSSPLSETSTSSSSSSSSSTNTETYDLTPETSNISIRKDGLLTAPEIKISLSELLPETPVRLSLFKDKTPPGWSQPTSENKTGSFQERTATFSFARKSRKSQRQERMRRQSTVYYIDVVAVIDYGAYLRFLNSAISRSEALEAIREYYSFVFNGMDLRYQNIPSINYRIRIRLTKVIVSETSTASGFTEQFRVSATPWDTVDALNALESFSEFAVGTGADFLNPYDHSMLFTGYDLSSRTSSGFTLTTTGLAYTSTLCRMDGKSVSVVEDHGGFQSIDTAAHELGHSLSAKHDGEENLCRSTDRYIMAGGSYPQTEANLLNPWQFSVCSANYFTTFINDETRTTRGQYCLNSPLTISASIPDVSDRLPGQEVSPDQQCAQIYGASSRLCRGKEFGDDICTAMFCFDPATEGTCYEQTAARGTTCGNGKICLEGQCVSDPRAPAVDENCLFGDQPGAAFSGKTCSAFVNGFTGYCYQALVRGRCCTSCKAVYRPVKDCEYGDQVDGCQASYCRFADLSYLQQCCGTCNYGSAITTTGTTTTEQDTSTAPTPAPTTAAGCVDNLSVLVNNMTCPVAAATTPSLCYQSSVVAVCCASCAAANSGVEGCEYGDRYPLGCSQATTCVGLEAACCQRCGGGNVITTPTPTTVDPTSTCLDNLMIRVNGLTCAVAVQREPELCAVQGVLNSCCFSCKQFGVTDSTTVSIPTTMTTVTVEAPLCNDKPLVQVNGLDCQVAIQINPSLCYDRNVARDCCFSCSQANSGHNGCEYGDREPEVCANLADCTGNVLRCCATCASGLGVERSSASIVRINTMWSLVIACIISVTTNVLTRKPTVL